MKDKQGLKYHKNEKWELRQHIKEKINVILSLSKMLEKISKDDKNRLFAGAFYAEAVSGGFSEEDVDFFIDYMVLREAVKYNKEEEIIEYIKKDVESVEEHKKRTTKLARDRMLMQKEFEKWRELGLKNGFKGEFIKKCYDCFYRLKNIENEIHYAILNMLLDERRKKSKQTKN